MIPAIETPQVVSENVPSMADINGYRRGFRQYWNNGVLYTFDTLLNIPDYVKASAIAGKDWISEMNAGGATENEKSPDAKTEQKEA